jgi:putative ABC transport system permease protein
MQGDMTLVVRTTNDPASIRSVVRNELKRIDRSVPVFAVKTMTERIDAALSADRMVAILLAIFGAAALLLAGVGIYGVMSYAVAQRTHEIGIRMALGASAADVLRLVVRNGMSLALVGVVVGLAGAYLLSRLIVSMLFGITPTDLPTFAIVTLGLVLVALIACYIPARRATKVDPLVALRYE